MQVSNSFWNVVQQYFAKGIILPLVVLSFVWIFSKSNRERRYALIAVLCASILGINGLTYRIFDKIGEGSTFYRLLWIFPIAFLVAVFLTDCVAALEAKKKSLVFFVMLLAVFLFSSKNSTEWVTLPDNIYQLDTDVIEVADALMEVTKEEPAYLYALDTITDDIRQYNAKVLLNGMESFDLELIFRGQCDNILSRNTQSLLFDNESDYYAVKKQDVMVCKLLENAGLKRVNETTNYVLYSLDKQQLEADWEICVLKEPDAYGFTNIEYIPIDGLQSKKEYVYLTDFGAYSNEKAYEEVLDEIERMHPEGIIINAGLSEQSDWISNYENRLEEIGIPYYCNNQEFQCISYENMNLCLIDNVKPVSNQTIDKCKDLLAQDTPMLLVLAKPLENKKTDEFYQLVTAKDSPVVQILTAEKGGYTKSLLNGHLLQYAAPADSKQMLNVIRLEALERKDYE